MCARAATAARSGELSAQCGLGAVRRLCRAMAKERGDEAMRQDMAPIRKGSARLVGRVVIGCHSAINARPRVGSHVQRTIRKALLQLHGALRSEAVVE